MNVSDVFLLYGHCRAVVRSLDPAPEIQGKNSQYLDAWLSPEMDRDDVAISTLCDSEQFAALGEIKQKALFEIRTHRMGWRATCGCFEVYWYHRPSTCVICGKPAPDLVERNCAIHSECPR